MTFYLRPAFVTADGDIITPQVEYVGEEGFRSATKKILYHVSVNDEGAGTPLAEIIGGKFVPIIAKILSISTAVTAVFTTDIAHGLSNGDRVFVSGTDGDFGDRSGVVANVTATTFELTGLAALVAGTKGRIHEVETVIKLTNFGATGLGDHEGVGPYIGFYVDTNANNRVNILFRDA